MKLWNSYGRKSGTVRKAVDLLGCKCSVPLCAHQGITSRVVALYRSYGVVIWWTTAVEIASALRRLVRMKQLASEDWLTARRLAADLAASWRVIQPSNALRAHAVQLVDRYDLKAADALQLAAAPEWSENIPGRESFHSCRSEVAGGGCAQRI